MHPWGKRWKNLLAKFHLWRRWQLTPELDVPALQKYFSRFEDVLLYYNALQCIMQASYIMPPIHVTDPCLHLCVSRLLHFHRRSSHFLRHAGICWWGLGIGEFWSSLGFPWHFQATFLLMSSFFLHVFGISSVSESIYFMHSRCAKLPRNGNFVEPGRGRILAWLSFLLACHITQVPCSGTTNSTDLEVIKYRVHHGWLVLLNAKFGQVLWSRNQEGLFSYSLWCMGPYGDGATTLSQIHPPSFRAPIGLMLCFFFQNHWCEKETTWYYLDVISCWQCIVYTVTSHFADNRMSCECVPLYLWTSIMYNDKYRPWVLQWPL